MTIFVQIAPIAASLSGEVAPSTSVRRLGALAITDRLERRFGRRPRAFIGSANDGLQGSNRGSLAGAFSARRSPSFGSEVETFTERHAGSQALHRRGHAGPERIMVGDPIQSSRLPT